jgi:diguanylate cyclase
MSEGDLGQNRFTLSFRDVATEAAYQSSTRHNVRLQGGLALATGVPIYVGLGFLDQQLVPSHYWLTLWTIRCTAILAAYAMYSVAYTPWKLAQNVHPWVAFPGLAAGGSLLAIFIVVPPENITQYYGGIILATFYTYNLSGTRFIWALAIDVTLFVTYNLVFLKWKAYPPKLLMVHDFFMLSSNLVGGVSGYLIEFQSRRLFLREQELKQERERHLMRSLHDPLTNLANRSLLHDRLEQALAHAQRDGLKHVGVFIDLDGFKRLNDKLGHQAGDVALKEVARRLLLHTRDTDTVSRLGGDEFFVLGYAVHSLPLAKQFAARLCESVKQPIDGVPDEYQLKCKRRALPLSLPGSHGGRCYPPSRRRHVRSQAQRQRQNLHCRCRDSSSFPDSGLGVRCLTPAMKETACVGQWATVFGFSWKTGALPLNARRNFHVDEPDYRFFSAIHRLTFASSTLSGRLPSFKISL